MGGLQVVVRDPRAQVVDVVEPDVAGEEAEDPRKFEVGASLERGIVEGYARLDEMLGRVSVG